ncbi:hypothetical protein BC831DRAFT_547776 [Entophlyctis helioformis]|nr:hypothetical protein BC831DRAFT_547776 [Entophlyctis helioformis]
MAGPARRRPGKSGKSSAKPSAKTASAPVDLLKNVPSDPSEESVYALYENSMPSANNAPARYRSKFASAVRADFKAARASGPKGASSAAAIAAMSIAPAAEGKLPSPQPTSAAVAASSSSKSRSGSMSLGSAASMSAPRSGSASTSGSAGRRNQSHGQQTQGRHAGPHPKRLSPLAGLAPPHLLAPISQDAQGKAGGKTLRGSGGKKSTQRRPYRLPPLFGQQREETGDAHTKDDGDGDGDRDGEDDDDDGHASHPHRHEHEADHAGSLHGGSPLPHKTLKSPEGQSGGGSGSGEAASSGMRVLSDTEREGILGGLKANLDRVLQQYGKLPVQVETPSRISRKLDLEKQIQTLEADIRQLSTSGQILVRQ